MYWYDPSKAPWQESASWSTLSWWCGSCGKSKRSSSMHNSSSSSARYGQCSLKVNRSVCLVLKTSKKSLPWCVQPTRPKGAGSRVFITADHKIVTLGRVSVGRNSRASPGSQHKRTDWRTHARLRTTRARAPALRVVSGLPCARGFPFRTAFRGALCRNGGVVRYSPEQLVITARTDFPWQDFDTPAV